MSLTLIFALTTLVSNVRGLSLPSWPAQSLRPEGRPAQNLRPEGRPAQNLQHAPPAPNLQHAPLAQNLRSRKDADCNDITGRYRDGHGKNVTVVQTACFLKVNMDWGPKEGVVNKQGTIIRDEILVSDFEKPGRLTVSGDIIFLDGGIWTKFSKSGVDSSIATVVDKETNMTVEVQVDVDGNDVDITNVTVNGDVMGEVDGETEAKASKASRGKKGNGDLIDASNGTSGAATTNMSTGEQNGDDEEIDFPIDRICTDISGLYLDTNGKDLKIYQVGCFIKVKIFWNDTVGYVMKVGSIAEDGVHVDDFKTIGKLTGDGGVYFADGGTWQMQKSQTPKNMAPTVVDANGGESTNSSADSTVSPTSPPMTHDSIDSGSTEDYDYNPSEATGTEDSMDGSMPSDARANKEDDGFGVADLNQTAQTAAEVIESVRSSGSHVNSWHTGSADTSDSDALKNLVTDIVKDIIGHYPQAGAAGATMAQALAPAATGNEAVVAPSATVAQPTSVTITTAPVTTQAAAPTQATVAPAASGNEAIVAPSATVAQPTSAPVATAPSATQAVAPTQAPYSQVKDVQGALGDSQLDGSIFQGLDAEDHSAAWIAANTWEEIARGDPVDDAFQHSAPSWASVSPTVVSNQPEETVTSPDVTGVRSQAEETGPDFTQQSDPAVDDFEKVDLEGPDFTEKSTPAVNEDVPMTTADDQPCVDISGRYKNLNGHAVTVKQDQCELEMLLRSSDGTADVFLSGSVDGSQVKVDTFKEMGSAYGESVKFGNGGEWQKMTEGNLLAVPKEGCGDLNGYYSIRTGKLVSVDQVGCQAIVTISDADNQTSSSRLGTIKDADLHVVGMKHVGSRQANGGIYFNNGIFWGWLKKGDQEFAATTTDSCGNVTGNYLNARGSFVTITQVGCHIKIQMFWDEKQGDITVGGYVFGNVIHAKRFRAMGQVDPASGTVNWFDGKVWKKLSGQESAELGIPEGGCSKVGGVYKDATGNPVVVKQLDCKLETTFWLDTLNANVTRDGYIALSTVHIQDFTMNGLVSDGDIHFGSISMWKNADAITAVKTDTADPSAVQGADEAQERIDHFEEGDAEGKIDQFEEENGLSGEQFASGSRFSLFKKGQLQDSRTVTDIVKGCNWGCYRERYPHLRNVAWEGKHGNLDYLRDQYIKYGHSSGKNCQCNADMLAIKLLDNAADAEEAKAQLEAVQLHKVVLQAGVKVEMVKGCDWKCYVNRYPDLRNSRWEMYKDNLNYARNHYIRLGHDAGKNCKCTPAKLR